MKWYSAILFLITLVAGLMEVVSGLKGDSITSLVPSDVFGGIVLLIVSAVFLRGLTHREHYAFYEFGSLMLCIFSVLYILAMLANGLDAAIVGEEWNPIDDLRIEMILLPFAIPGTLRLIREKRELPP
ncbi:hypothetical protein DRP05_02315 [Archaeoglobales archaeon]|nr:MAG: hypothetical protein DRP05_02315 [Archaeoglobales archaeon]